MGKAQTRITNVDLTKKSISADKVLHGMSRQNHSALKQSIAVVGNNGGLTAAPSSGFLKVSGGSMIGPIALDPKSAAVTVSGGKGHLNLSSVDGRYTSNIILESVASGGKLSYIDGNAFEGQLLKIHVLNGESLIPQTDGNIVPSQGLISAINGPTVVNFIFDSTLSPNGNSGGWLQEGGGSGGGGSAVLTESWDYAMSPETGPLILSFTVTDGIPYNFTITDVQAYLVTAGFGSNKLTVSILYESGINTGTFNGIFSTPLTIDSGKFTSVGASVPFVLSTTNIVKGRRLQYVISQLDSSQVATGLKVILIGHQ